MATEPVAPPLPLPPPLHPGFAAAKINLALHVTGQRADGYHLLDSLVVFAAVGDQVSARIGDRLGLRVVGPYSADVPAGKGNLVLRAARLLHPDRGADLLLEKVMPVASGIGGGSADAAAALRVLANLWGVALPEPAGLLSLGADLPVCLSRLPARMSGIGERLDPLPLLPPVWLVLVNPGQPVATPAVFHGLQRRSNPPLPAVLPEWASAADLATWLAAQRNDLQAAAVALQPAIAAVLSALAARPACLMARMSGSGATCFGLFPDRATAAAAAAALTAHDPHWWVAAAPVLPAA